MDTIHATPEVAEAKRDRPRSPLAAAVLLALVIGGFIGWFSGASSGGEEEVSAVLSATGEPLTERQQQMLDIVDDYVGAWQATDGDLAATYMTEDAYLRYPDRGWDLNAADGTLQSHIGHERYASLRAFDATIVYDNRVVLTGEIESAGIEWISIIQFATDNRIAGELIVDW